MTQVEIAKKILEQGDCNYDCHKCHFAKPNTFGCSVGSFRSFSVDTKQVKQWLKEQESGVMPDRSKTKKWETVMDVPASLWGKALVKYKTSSIGYSTLLMPITIGDSSGKLHRDLHYLPLGQPLDGEWLEFESEVTE